MTGWALVAVLIIGMVVLVLLTVFVAVAIIESRKNRRRKL